MTEVAASMLLSMKALDFAAASLSSSIPRDARFSPPRPRRRGSSCSGCCRGCRGTCRANDRKDRLASTSRIGERAEPRRRVSLADTALACEHVSRADEHRILRRRHFARRPTSCGQFDEHLGVDDKKTSLTSHGASPRPRPRAREASDPTAEARSVIRERAPSVLGPLGLPLTAPSRPVVKLPVRPPWRSSTRKGSSSPSSGPWS